MTRALVLVDFQHDYLANERLQPPADALVARAARLLDGCRRRRIPVIHLWTTIDPQDDRRLPHWKASHRWQCVSGTAGHDAPTALRPVDGEAVVHKSGFDGFVGDSLHAALARAGAEAVILAGVHMHACVRAAALGCLERGLRVVIAEDAVGSDDPIHAAATRRWLAARTVRLLPVRAVLADLGGPGSAALVHRSPRQVETVLFEVPIASAGEVADAVAQSRTAWSTWRHTDLGGRRQMLDRLATRLEASAADLARQMAAEIGKPLSHALEETRRAAANIRDVARRAALPGDPDLIPAAAPHGARVRHQPLGVVALISPWNNPVAIPAGKIAPALVYGNTVVWKPAPAATAVARSVLALIAECGAPADVVRIVEGDRTTAQQLAAAESIDAVTFTGSEPAGYDLQEICARRCIPLQAELGGNNAAVVCDDADLPRAAREVAWGAFGFAGQRCTANRRVIVVGAARFERLWDELRSAASRLVWRDPLDPAADLGPVISLEKRDEIAEQIERAAADGGARRVDRLFDDRAREPWARAGAYAQPVLAACDRPEHLLVQEESMGPVLVVQRADDFDHALSLLNGVRHGLAAALFSNRADLQRRFLADARAGILKLNASTAGVDVTLPFGGWKASGVGPPEHGVADRMFYTRIQAVYA
jgi:acyl-CoA reductase-like NAD-dependent aldehyde dehydrogenase/nicotinamidase-related amidase